MMQLHASFVTVLSLFITSSLTQFGSYKSFGGFKKFGEDARTTSGVVDVQKFGPGSRASVSSSLEVKASSSTEAPTSTPDTTTTNNPTSSVTRAAATDIINLATTVSNAGVTIETTFALKTTSSASPLTTAATTTTSYSNSNPIYTTPTSTAFSTTATTTTTTTTTATPTTATSTASTSSIVPVNSPEAATEKLFAFRPTASAFSFSTTTSASTTAASTTTPFLSGKFHAFRTTSPHLVLNTPSSTPEVTPADTTAVTATSKEDRTPILKRINLSKILNNNKQLRLLAGSNAPQQVQSGGFRTEDRQSTVVRAEQQLPAVFRSEHQPPTVFRSEKQLPALFKSEQQLPAVFRPEEPLQSTVGRVADIISEASASNADTVSRGRPPVLQRIKNRPSQLAEKKNNKEVRILPETRTTVDEITTTPPTTGTTPQALPSEKSSVELFTAPLRAASDQDNARTINTAIGQKRKVVLNFYPSRTTTQDAQGTSRTTTQAAEGTSRTTTQDAEGTSRTTTQAAEGTSRTTTQDAEGTSRTTTQDAEGTSRTTTQAAEGTSRTLTQAAHGTSRILTQAAEGTTQIQESAGKADNLSFNDEAELGTGENELEDAASSSAEEQPEPPTATTPVVDILVTTALTTAGPQPDRLTTPTAGPTENSSTAPAEATARPRLFFDRGQLKEKLKGVVLSVIEDSNTSTLQQKIEALKEKIVAESPAGIREHIESQGDRFNQEASKLFSLEDTNTTARSGQLTASPKLSRPLLFSRIRRPLPEPEIAVPQVDESSRREVLQTNITAQGEEVSRTVPIGDKISVAIAKEIRNATIIDEKPLSLAPASLQFHILGEEMLADHVEKVHASDPFPVKGLTPAAEVNPLIDEIFVKLAGNESSWHVDDDPTDNSNSSSAESLTAVPKHDGRAGVIVARLDLAGQLYALSLLEDEQEDEDLDGQDEGRDGQNISVHETLADAEYLADNQLTPNISGPVEVEDRSLLTSQVPVRPKLEVGKFLTDEAGSLMLVNSSGHAMARAPPGYLIPTLEALPDWLSPDIQITPVFITDTGEKGKISGRVMKRVEQDLALLHTAHASRKVFFPRGQSDIWQQEEPAVRQPETEKVIQYQRSARRFFS